MSEAQHTPGPLRRKRVVVNGQRFAVDFEPTGKVVRVSAVVVAGPMLPVSLTGAYGRAAIAKATGSAS